MQKASLILCVCLFCAPAFTQETGGKWPKRLWRASVAAIAAGSVMDVYSSLGKSETNGLLANRQGQLSMSGIGLKLAVAGAAIGTQQYVLHKRPASAVYKAGAIMNFAFAGTLGGVAAHNYGVHRSN